MGWTLERNDLSDCTPLFCFNFPVLVSNFEISIPNEFALIKAINEKNRKIRLNTDTLREITKLLVSSLDQINQVSVIRLTVLSKASNLIELTGKEAFLISASVSDRAETVDLVINLKDGKAYVWDDNPEENIFLTRFLISIRVKRRFRSIFC